MKNVIDRDTREIKILSAPAGRGAAWLFDGFGIFKKNWLTWIGVEIVLIFLLIFGSIILSVIIPMVGSSVTTLILPVFIGGFMQGCRAVDRGNAFTFDHLFSGFSEKPGPLMIIGVVHLLGSLLIMVFCLIVFIVIMGSLDAVMQVINDAVQAYLAKDVNRLAEISQEFFLVIVLVELIGLALYVPLLVLLWFAPVLVMLEDMNAFTAMKYSFTGCVKNIIPYLVYGIVGLVLTFLATIPLGLGWLILMPMIIASVYLSYKDIYIGVGDTLD